MADLIKFFEVTEYVRAQPCANQMGAELSLSGVEFAPKLIPYEANHAQIAYA
jgi:hypothetical protein